jgi:hypothetical protein
MKQGTGAVVGAIALTGMLALAGPRPRPTR